LSGKKRLSVGSAAECTNVARGVENTGGRRCRESDDEGHLGCGAGMRGLPASSLGSVPYL